MHERLRPVASRFVYPLFCVRVDLDRLDDAGNRWFGIDCRRPLSLRLCDYGPRDGSPLAPWLRALLADAGLPADGAIWLQTIPRLFGHAFNPVSFWFCHDRAGALRAVLAEVNNTFGESHRYLLAAPGAGAIGADTMLSSRKVFHVSPFLGVEGCYAFRFRETATTSFVGIDHHDRAGVVLRTSIGGRLAPLTAARARRLVLCSPFNALAVLARIHWQALRLWWRRVPFHRKPAPPQAALSRSEEAQP
ncbi:DUF1365 domain-containing protein [Jeongeupia chitinilytica]|uniref:DUF1365 domain-containing protein n=2 Tax=Jeongeupia chitinilytica TaxID=1041641 RepID=A0ABQ3H0G6_9NEIS|nr:DUF1365 domain-containing protein [Jeongeupia chitinilytica]